MQSTIIRQKFFDFFSAHRHTVVPSSSLIPAQDPTLLFANAGMNQFKDAFLGKEIRAYKRAVSIQKCMRAGGKHNDLENVGFTKRHLTFFEMMGNFSFGDYFKKEAIEFAWNFITKDLAMPSENLYATVYKKDDEAYDIWHNVIGLPEDRIVRLAEADNFWQMGDTGPCGPCSEMYIDRGMVFGCGKDSCAPGCSCDRFLEFWNLVFMQFDRQADGTDKPLKQVGVDTGMGLERLCAILQNKDSVFETDIFQPIIARIQELTGVEYDKQNPTVKAAFHVIADHIRASCFLIADGCSPSNEGRGYVLRKIIRRAALFAKKLTQENIFPELAHVIIQHMAMLYPELSVNKEAIVALLTHEIERFSANLIHGQHILQEYFKAQQDSKLISGQQAFKLYDTYGFPLELTKVIAQEHGFCVDSTDFDTYMDQQREQSGKKDTKNAQITGFSDELTTAFTGYEHLKEESNITGLLVYNAAAEYVGAGQECWVIMQKSPFYVECGGQVNDKGWIVCGNNNQVAIEDLKKLEGGAIAIKIHAPCSLSLGDSVVQIVDSGARLATMKNHTATHLLQAALMHIFGKQIKQAGSLVAPDYLRFDFTYHDTLTSTQIKQVEDIVNTKIMENIPLAVSHTTFKDAVAKGVIAFFGDKYNQEDVRVVQIPGFSAELCGGTHVHATGDIGSFKITEITALSSGQRRIVAVTGPKAVELFQATFATVKTLAQEYKIQLHEVIDAIDKQKESLKTSHALIKKIKKQQIKLYLPVWLNQLDTVNSVPFLYINLEYFLADELKDLVTQLMQKKPGLYVAVSQQDETSTVYVAFAQEYSARISIKNLAVWLKDFAGLRCGGKDLTLQGGGNAVPKDFEQQLKNWIKQQ